MKQIVKFLALVVLVVGMTASGWAEQVRVTDAGGEPHWRVSHPATASIQVREHANKARAGIVLFGYASNVLETLTLTNADNAVIVAPAGDWQWWAGHQQPQTGEVVYIKRFVFRSAAPNFYRINIVLPKGAKPSTESWGKWTKIK